MSMQTGWHASEATGSSSTEASHSMRTDSDGLAEVWLQHAWKLPASPHLAVAAEGMIMRSAQDSHCIKDAVECTAQFDSLLAAQGFKIAKDCAQILRIVAPALTSLSSSRERSDGLADKSSSSAHAGSICRQACVRDSPHRDSWRPCKPRAFRHSPGECSASAWKLSLRCLSKYLLPCAAAMRSQ